MLSIDHVSVSFNGVKAVDDAQFAVPEGQVTGLIGPNGAGKTSLINAISGFYRIASGTIRLEERRIDRLPVHRIAQAGVQRTFQHIRLFSHLSVLENLAVGFLSNRKGNMKAAAHASYEALEVVNLSSYADSRPTELPYAFQRRVEIARAIVAKPKLLLLDEPAAGMHSNERHDLVLLVRRLAEDGLTILMIEHDMAMIEEACDQIVVMNFGQVVAQGTMSQIRSNDIGKSAYLGTV